VADDVQPAAIVGVCEDDATLRSVLERSLRAEGMIVVAVSTGRTAIERFCSVDVAVIVLDIGLPDADGRDVCQALRASGVTAPVLFLTARGEITDRVSGFTAGGDDPHAADPATEEHGLGAVAGKEPVARGDRLASVARKAAVAHQQRSAAAATEHVTEVVAEDRGDGGYGDDDRQRELSRASEQSGRQQGGLARDRDAGRLREHEARQGHVADLCGHRDQHRSPAIGWVVGEWMAISLGWWRLRAARYRDGA